MTAAKNRHIKATKPLETWPGGVRQYATEQELRDAQAREWTGQFVAFDFEGQRVAGRVVNCRTIPRMEPDEISDFAVVVESLKTPGKTVKVRLVRERCQFYATLKEARRDRLLLQAGKEGA